MHRSMYAALVATSLSLACGGETPPAGSTSVPPVDAGAAVGQPDAGMTMGSARPDAAMAMMGQPDASAPMPRPGTGGIEVSANVHRALILIDMKEMTVGEVTLPRSFRDLDAKMHTVCLRSASAGRVGCSEIMVKADEMASTQVPLSPKQDGLWRRLEDNRYERVVTRLEKLPDLCPDTWVSIPLGPFGAVCVESDGTLSLCKHRSAACDGSYAEGRILENGDRMEISFETSSGSGHNTFIRQ